MYTMQEYARLTEDDGSAHGTDSLLVGAALTVFRAYAGAGGFADKTLVERHGGFLG